MNDKYPDMMTTFEDGPAKGARLSLSRSPLLMRVVYTDAGEVDALDKLEDEPREGESIRVYILCGAPVRGFIDGRGKDGKRWGRSLSRGVYRLFERQLEGKLGRDRSSWELFCQNCEGLARKRHEEFSK